MTRSGVHDFKNNKNFMLVEAWEEYDDGTLIRKIVHDDSYGKKVLEKKVIKLDLSKLANVHMVCDEKGYFKYFQDSATGTKYHSLAKLVESNKALVEWEYSDQTVDLIGQDKMISVKRGQDNHTKKSWRFEKEWYHSDCSEIVHNQGKDAQGEWDEHWTKKANESWATKHGFIVAADGTKINEWSEKWYQKNRGSEDDIEESTCEKWGKNLQT